MIKAVRVDYRLLHGQVAVGWTNYLGADCILLVTDTLLDDPIRVQSVKLAKPPGVKVVVKNVEDSIKAINSGITDKYKLFIVCETIEEAVKLGEHIEMSELNIGGTTPGDGKKQLATVVYVTPKEEELIKNLQEKGVNVVMQMLPDVKKQQVKL